MRVERYGAETFSNGLEVVLERNDLVQDFHLFFASKTGMEKERLRELHALHLAEHMFYRSQSIDETLRVTEELENLGIQSNGQATFDYCHGYFFGPTRQRKRIVSAAFQALTNDRYDAQEFEHEKGIVEVDIAELLSNATEIQADELLLEHLYRGTRFGTGWERSVANVRKLTRNATTGLRDRLFRPENMVIVALSRRKFGEVLQLVDETFGQLPSRGRIPPYTAPLPDRRPALLEFDHTGLMCAFARHTIRAGPINGNDFLENLATLHVLKAVLQGGDSSVLYRELRLKRGLTYSPSAEVARDQPEFLLHFAYHCKEEHLDETRAILDGILEDLAKRSIPSDDLRRYQKIAIEDFDNDIGAMEERGTWYVKNASAGAFVRPYDLKKAIRAVTPMKLRHAIENWRPGMTSVIFHPKAQNLGDIIVARQPALVNSSLPEGTPGSDTSSMPDPVILNPS